jgi:hypothetical protein
MTGGGRRVGVVDSVVGLNVRTFVDLRGGDIGLTARGSRAAHHDRAAFISPHLAWCSPSPAGEEGGTGFSGHAFHIS